jgi:hypothetical protein
MLAYEFTHVVGKAGLEELQKLARSRRESDA